MDRRGYAYPGWIGGVRLPHAMWYILARSPRSVLEVEKKEEEEEEEEEPKEEEEEPEKEVDPKEIELSPRPGVNLSQKKMALTRQRNSGNGGNPDIAAIFAQQLQNIIPQIVTQVTNNVNNANGNGGNTNDGNRNGGNNGCSYKEFLACKPRDFNGKGVQTRGRKAANEMTWESFKAFLVEEFFPSNEMEKLEITLESKCIGRYIHGLVPQIYGMLRATQPTMIQSAILTSRILTDEGVRCGTLSKGNEKRKVIEETSKQGGSGNDNKRAKVGRGFMAATPHRNEYAGSYPKCAKC
ncbi:hypothetical protein Tco_0963741 [Tanacetum coccineum]